MKNVNFLKNQGIDVDSSLELFGDINLYNETIKDFLESSADKKEKLMYFKHINSLNEYAVFAHTFKSDAKYLGFTFLYDIAIQHEEAGKNNNQKYILKDFDNFVENIDLMIEICKNYLSDEIITHEKYKKNVVIIDSNNDNLNQIYNGLVGLCNINSFNDVFIGKDYVIDNESSIDTIIVNSVLTDEINGKDLLRIFNNYDILKSVEIILITSEHNFFTDYNVKIIESPIDINKLRNFI